MLGARFIININILYYMVDLALIILNVLHRVYLSMKNTNSRLEDV